MARLDRNSISRLMNDDWDDFEEQPRIRKMKKEHDPTDKKDKKPITPKKQELE